MGHVVHMEVRGQLGVISLLVGPREQRVTTKELLPVEPS